MFPMSLDVPYWGFPWPPWVSRSTFVPSPNICIHPLGSDVVAAFRSWLPPGHQRVCIWYLQRVKEILQTISIEGLSIINKHQSNEVIEYRIKMILGLTRIPMELDEGFLRMLSINHMRELQLGIKSDCYPTWQVNDRPFVYSQISLSLWNLPLFFCTIFLHEILI